VPEQFGQTAEELRRVPEGFGQLPETFGRAPEEFRQLTEKVGRVPVERGGVTEEVRWTAKELRGCTVAKILPEIFMRFPARFEFKAGRLSSEIGSKNPCFIRG
jgi:hypothetical protein